MKKPTTLLFYGLGMAAAEKPIPLQFKSVLNSKMVLEDLNQGETAIIAKVRGRGAFRRRIMEMGFVAGKRVTVVRKAPMLDPVEYNVLGYNVSLRNSEAKLIEVVSEAEAAMFGEQSWNGVFVTGETPQGIHPDRWPQGRGCGHGHGQGFGYGRNQNPGSRRHRRHHFEHHPWPEAAYPPSEITVAVVGNPNAGKTSLFNVLSGAHERVGNYSGVTVDAKEIRFKYGRHTINLVDLPGTYSITAYTSEEIYVRNYIIEKLPDVVLNVVDASNLERNLYLTTQLIDMDIKVVMALNMFDEVEKKGDKLDFKALGALTGIPMVPTVASRGRGLEKLLNTLVSVFEDRCPVVRHIHINYGPAIEKSVKIIQETIKNEPLNADLTDRVSSRYLALKLLENDPEELKRVSLCQNSKQILKVAAREISRVEEFRGETIETVITDSKYGFINGALQETLVPGSKESRQRTEAIDRLLTHRLLGIPVFMGLMWLMFQATFTIGSYPMDWIDNMVQSLSDFVGRIMAEGILKDLLIDGVIGGVGGVIIFLPNIVLLFLFISLMEDTGYMARAVFIMDKAMHKIGLHGKSVIPLLMGFGCTVPAIMATRTLENRNDRMITMLINPFMSCSARLPVYVLLISAFFPDHPGTLLFVIYVLGVLVAIAAALLLKKTLFRIDQVPFVMELPPYRIPTARAIVVHMWDKAVEYLRKIAGIILVASIIIWALGYFPLDAGETRKIEKQKHEAIEIVMAQKSADNLDVNTFRHLADSVVRHYDALMVSEQQLHSYIGRIGHLIAPAIEPLGFDWKMGVSILAGVPGKEIVVSTMGVLYSPGDESKISLISRLQSQTYPEGPRMGEKVFSPLVALSFMVFVLLYFPCMGTIAVISREAGHWKWGAFVIVYTTAIAWIASFLVYQIGLLL